MARHSFAALGPAFAAGALMVIAVAALPACTAQPEKPQAPAISTSPLPNPLGAPPSREIQPPPPGNPAPQSPQEMTTEGHTRVALLVPLTGANKAVGQAMLDAGNLALFDVSSDLALLPRDSGSSPEGSKAAADKALADGAGLILGPVFSASVAPVRASAEPVEVNVITYSTDASVAGGNVFVIGFLPTQQVDRIVGYAKSRGLSKLAALVPDNPYGTTVATEIGVMRDRLAMPPPRILTLGRDPKALLAELATDPPEMLLIALGGDQLKALAPTIAEFTAQHPLQLLGTGLWDDATLGQQAPQLIGAWYPAPAPVGFTNFDQKFRQTYSYAPPRIASLAYDAVALAAAIAKGSPGNPRPFGKDVLTQPSGFLGIDGPFRFLPSGLSERNLAVLAVGGGGPTVLDPPPPTFEKLGE